MMNPDPMQLSSRHRGLLGVKDTIESIVVAFILAFAFRAFVAEAFVIPTGSMAPNLYGMHRMQTCWVCGTEYAYGFSPIEGRPPIPPSELVCTNCGHRHKQIRDEPDNGDRIFVLKWLFDVGRMLPDVLPHGSKAWWHVFKPCRWDVVVFKDPHDGTTNFIKRLIGLPGEVLEIIDGDIYSASEADLTATAEGRSVLEKLRAPRQFTEAPSLIPQEQRALDQVLCIQRKTNRAQQVLWMTAYDHDNLPVKKRDLAGWKATDRASGWDTRERKLRFDPAQSSRPQEIMFSRGNPDSALSGDGIETLVDPPVTDAYAYNGSREAYIMGGSPQADQINVSDLRLRCLLVPKGGSGELKLSLSKRDDIFVATFGSDGGIRLTRSSVNNTQEAPEVIGEAKIRPLEVDKPVRIALTNVDYRVCLWVEEQPVIQTTDAQYPSLKNGKTLAEHARGLRRDASNAAPNIRIIASGMRLELWHVTIDRDVYYRTYRDDHGRVAGWGVQTHPIYLRNQPNKGIQEYFCLGDNSPLSKDSRLWTDVGPHLTDKLITGEYQFGTVPADQMIGRAFFVYWPAGFPLVTERLPLLPNVGDMRLIR